MLWDLLEGIFGAISATISYFAGATAETGLSPDLEIVVLLLIVLTIWLASGCWAGAIAGSRKRSTKLNFIGGLMIPFIYPLTILFALDIKGAKHKDMRRRQEEDEAALAEEMKTADEFEATAVPEAAPQAAFDMGYFKRIALDAEGNPTGPWLIETEDSEIVTRRIIDCLPQVVVLEIQGAGDKTQRVRIPYIRITGCSPI